MNYILRKHSRPNRITGSAPKIMQSLQHPPCAQKEGLSRTPTRSHVSTWLNNNNSNKKHDHHHPRHQTTSTNNANKHHLPHQSHTTRKVHFTTNLSLTLELFSDRFGFGQSVFPSVSRYASAALCYLPRAKQREKRPARPFSISPRTTTLFLVRNNIFDSGLF